MTSWRHVLCVLVVLAASALTAAAQAELATVTLTITLPTGAAAIGARVEVSPVGAGAVRVGSVSAERPIVVLPLSPGPHRIRVELAAFRAAEATEVVRAGSALHVTVRLAPTEGMGNSLVSVENRYETSYQTNLGTRWLTDLPSARTVGSLLETAHPFLIGDRMDNGGLWSARAARLGGSGPSWNQTQYRLAGMDATDVREGGTPALFADLGVFDAVTVETARVAADVTGSGPVITLVPRRPGEHWTGTGQAFITPGAWQSDAVPGGPPALARFDHWTDATITAGGPVANRTGVFTSIRGTHASRVERAEGLEMPNHVGALYGHLVGTPDADRELRITTALSRQTRPFDGRARYATRDLDERGRMLLAQAAVEELRDGHLIAISAGYQRASNSPHVGTATVGGNIERLLDGPPLAIADAAVETISQRWTFAASFSPAPGAWLRADHQLRVGVSVSGSRASDQALNQPTFGELVDGVPARVWDVRSAGVESSWSSTSLGAFVSDRWAVRPRVTVDAGLRFDVDRGSSDGAANGISWPLVAPRVGLRWVPSDTRPLAISTSYGWYRNRLPLDYLRVGDPNGQTGTVYRWDDRNGDTRYTQTEITPIAYVGACCAGGARSSIDPNLAAPYVTEFVIGAEHRFGAWRGRITGIDRREHKSVALVNTGVALSEYRTVDVPDKGIDVDGNSTAQTLRIFGRTSAMFGRDRYALTNPAGLTSRYQGVDIAVDRDFGRTFFRFGGSAYRINATGMNRGFLSNENDPGLLGEAFLTPNALTSGAGRTFFDRAFVMKVSGGYRAPGDVRVGMVARYQDGQPFSRLVLADGLYQGRDLVMAIPRGAQRFTYTFTLDAKLEKTLRFGRHEVGLIAEAFNVTDATMETEEYVVTGSNFRRVSAVQPPRALRAGVRVDF